MNYYELLNQYLDGSLSEAEQQVFFSALADNSALRQEFNDEILVRTAVRERIIAEAPPADLTNAIFSAVGYSGNTVATAGAATQTSGIIKIGGYLLTFIAGCVAIWLWNPRGSSNDISRNTAVTTTQYQNQQFNNNTTTAPMPPSPAASMNKHSNQQQPNNNYSNEYTQFAPIDSDIQLSRISKNNHSRLRLANSEKQNNLSENLLSANADTPSNLMTINTVQTPQVNQELEQKTKQDILTTTPIVNLNSTEIVSKNTNTTPKQPEFVQREPITPAPSPNDFIFSIRSLQSIPNTEDIASNNTIGINNIAAALLYKVNTNLALGLEGGREPFYQEFTHTTDSSTEFIKQNPTLSWVGPVARFVMPSWGWNEIIYPFAQAGGGIAESGMYLYGSTGICIVPIDRVSMNIGVGYTRLQYTAYSNQYSTGKVGWSYSMNIHF